jgi:hypothetical protein
MAYRSSSFFASCSAYEVRLGTSQPSYFSHNQRFLYHLAAQQDSNAEDVMGRPLGELNLSHELGLQPTAVFHICFC